MLPKSRVLAILILGIGCVLLTAGLVLPKLVSADRPVPLDLADSELSVVDPAATVGRSYLATAKDSDPDVVTGAVARRWAVGFGEPADEDSTAATVGVSTIREDIASSVGDDAGLLDAEVWSMRVDRNSGEVRQGDGDTRVADTLGSPAATASVDGQWLKFPRHTKMQSYPFFDTLLRRAVAAEFTRSEELDGHEVYVFRQDLAAEPVQQSNPGYARLTQSVATPGEGDRPGSSSVSTLHRSGTREISVEPSSGMIVSVREDLRDYYAAADGTETGVLLDFHGQTPDDQRAGLVDQAVSVGEGRPVGVWRLALTVIGAIVTVAAGIVALRPQRRGQRDGVGTSGI